MSPGLNHVVIWWCVPPELSFLRFSRTKHVDLHGLFWKFCVLCSTQRFEHSIIIIGVWNFDSFYQRMYASQTKTLSPIQFTVFSIYIVLRKQKRKYNNALNTTSNPNGDSHYCCLFGSYQFLISIFPLLFSLTSVNAKHILTVLWFCLFPLHRSATNTTLSTAKCGSHNKWEQSSWQSLDIVVASSRSGNSANFTFNQQQSKQLQRQWSILERIFGRQTRSQQQNLTTFAKKSIYWSCSRTQNETQGKTKEVIIWGEWRRPGGNINRGKFIT